MTIGIPSLLSAQCAGDCAGNNMVAINEIITCVNIALGMTAPSVCAACDVDHSGTVAINELIAAVNAALNGCPAPATPTAMSTSTATASVSPSAMVTASRTTTASSTATGTVTRTITASSTLTPSVTQTSRASATASPTASGSASPTPTGTSTPTRTSTTTATTGSLSPTFTPMGQPSFTPTASRTPTASGSPSATVTVSPATAPAQLTVRTFSDDGVTSAGPGVEVRIGDTVVAVTGGDGTATLELPPGPVTIDAVLPHLGGAAATVDLAAGEERAIDLVLDGEGLARDATLESDQVHDGILAADATTLVLRFLDSAGDPLVPSRLDSLLLEPARGGFPLDLSEAFELMGDGSLVAADLAALRMALESGDEGGVLDVRVSLPGGTTAHDGLPIALPAADPALADARSGLVSGAATPSPTPVELEIMARTGGKLTSIDARVSINDAGTVAFAGQDQQGSKGFVATQPGRPKAVTFLVSSNRTYSGSAINNDAIPEIVIRELVQGPSFFIRKWRQDGQSLAVVGRSGAVAGICTGGLNAGQACLTSIDCSCFGIPFCTPGFCLTSGGDFDSATSFVDLNDGGVATFPGLIDGATTLALFRGAGSPLEIVTEFASTATTVRPQIANTGDVVIRDGDGRIVVYPNASTLARVIAGPINGVQSTGSHPGISPRGDVVAFTGARAAGPGVFIAPNEPASMPMAVAGDALEDDFTAFADGQRVGVVSSGTGRITVVFVGTRAGIDGIYVVHARFADDGLALTVPQKIVQVGDEIADTTVTAFTLYDPINNNRQIAFSASLADGTQAVIRATLESAITAIEPNEVKNRRCDKVFSIPVAGDPGNVHARTLMVSFEFPDALTDAATDALPAGTPFRVCAPGWANVPACEATMPTPPMLDDEGRALLPITVAEPSAVGLTDPVGHPVSYEVSLSADADEAIRRSESFVALWAVPELRTGAIPRYSKGDVGGDDWAAARTIDWLRDIAPKLQAECLLLAVNDISGEHGINLGHCDHEFGTDLDIYHFQNLLPVGQPLNGMANYRAFEELVKLAFAGDEQAKAGVADFIEANRRGLAVLFTQSQPPGAVATVYSMIGIQLTVATGTLPAGWAHLALRSGRIVPLEDPELALDLGIGEWNEPYVGRIMPNDEHNNHFHVDLDERAIGAPIPEGCTGKRFPCKPAAVGSVARTSIGAPVCQ